MFPVALALTALTSSSVLRTFDLAVAKSPDARVIRAVALELAGEPHEALADWQALAELRPTDHRPHLHRARILLALRQTDEARDAVERAADLSRLVHNEPEIPPAPMLHLDPLTGAVLPDVTLPAAKPATPASPGRLVVWLPEDVVSAQAKLLVANGRWSDALPLLADLVNRRPQSLETRLLYGRSLLAWTRYDEAETAFASALQLDDTDPTAIAGLAYSRIARGQTVPAPVGDEPLAWAARARLALSAGDAETAVADAVAALAAEPGSYDLASLAVHALIATDQPTVAVLVLSNALDRPWPEATRAGLYTVRATAWMRAGSLPAAERDADRATALDPLDPVPGYVRGQIAEARDDYRAAVSEYTALVNRTVPHGPAVFRLAVLRASAPDPAVRDGDAAVAIADRMPAGPHAHGLRAAGHAEAGRYSQAVSEINAALATQPPAETREQFLRMRACFLADRPWRGDEE